MVNAPTKHFSPLLASKYSQLTNQLTRWHHQANEGKRVLEAEGVQALAAWRSLRRNQNLSIENIREMLFLSNEEQEKWIEDYVERGTAVARKQVQHVETAIMQALDDMSIAQVAGATSWKPKKTLYEMINAIRDSLRDLARSDDEQNGARGGRSFRKYRAWQAEWWWWTWLGDGDNHYNSTAPHGENSAKADEAGRIDPTGLGGCSQHPL
jgi:hypothetical protein